MEGHCSAGQSPQWAVVPMEEEEEGFISLETNSLECCKMHCVTLVVVLCKALCMNSPIELRQTINVEGSEK